MNPSQNVAVDVRRLILCFLFAFFAFFRGQSAFALNETTTIATITITNSLGTTNGETITLLINTTNTNNSVTYTWTNVAPNALGFKQLAATNTAAKSATNLYTKFTNDLTGRVLITYASSTSVKLQTSLNGILSGSISTNWGTLVFTTNAPANNVTLTASNFLGQTATISNTLTTTSLTATNVTARDGTFTGTLSLTNPTGNAVYAIVANPSAADGAGAGYKIIGPVGQTATIAIPAPGNDLVINLNNNAAAGKFYLQVGGTNYLTLANGLVKFSKPLDSDFQYSGFLWADTDVGRISSTGPGDKGYIPVTLDAGGTGSSIIPSGTNGNVLTEDSTAPTGWKSKPATGSSGTNFNSIRVTNTIYIGTNGITLSDTNGDGSALGISTNVIVSGSVTATSGTFGESTVITASVIGTGYLLSGANDGTIATGRELFYAAEYIAVDPITTDTTIDFEINSDGTFYVDASTNNITITLADASTILNPASGALVTPIYCFARLDGSTNTVTITAATATIKWQAAIMLPPGASENLIYSADTTNWLSKADAIGIGDPGQILVVDDDHNRVFKTIMVSGRTNITATGTTRTINIGHTLPSTNYTPSVSILGPALITAVQPTYSAITASTFDVNFPTGGLGASNTNLAWSVIYNP